MKRIIITMLVTVMLSGCTNILRKKITLLDNISHPKVIYQDETVSISFSKNELVQEMFKDNSQDTIVKVHELISLQEDILLPTDIGELYNSPDSLKSFAYAVFDKVHIIDVILNTYLRF